MRAAWLTDLHLDFVDRAQFEALTQHLADSGAETVLIGGDIAHAPDVCDWLERLAVTLRVPIYFVLGNHDYYGGSIAGVRAAISALADRTPNLAWLGAAGAVSLTPQTALIGHDGWGDGGYGDARGTPVLLNDFLLIEELRVTDPIRLGERRPEDRERLLSVLRQLGEESASHLRRALTEALQNHRHVVALTHVPPFREAAWHRDGLSDDNWLPFFVCKAAGDALRDVMAAHPVHSLTVLCGHTHGAGRCRVLPNLEVITGGADYGRPKIQQIFELQ
jgi:predicted phosphohydrolase